MKCVCHWGQNEPKNELGCDDGQSVIKQKKQVTWSDTSEGWMERKGSAAAASSKQQAGMVLNLWLKSHPWRRLTANLLRSNELNKGETDLDKVGEAEQEERSRSNDCEDGGVERSLPRDYGYVGWPLQDHVQLKHICWGCQ